MTPGEKRVYRLSLTVALSLAAAYALPLDIPFLSPLFAFALTAAPKPPMGLKGLLGLSLVLFLTLGTGLLIVPLLLHYPATALLLVLAGLFFSNHLAINLGKGPVAMLLTAGITLISAAGLASFELATTVVNSLVLGVILAVICQWIVYPFFPEDSQPPAPPAPAVGGGGSTWVAMRATLIVFPTYLLALVNPTFYLPIIMKAVALGQQASVEHADASGRELLGSTLMGGLLAMLFWLGLKLAPNLWMFFLWTLLFSLYISAKFYGLSASRFPPSFWQNVMITLLILLGPAVADSDSGKDVYKAFAVRMGLFVAVTLYAWMALLLLERLRLKFRNKGSQPTVTPRGLSA